MATVIETSIWIDFFRPKTPAAVKSQIKPWILRPDLALCEPIVCELLRSAVAKQRSFIQRHLATIPILPTPRTLWPEAIRLGQQCQDGRIIVGALDLLIATVCIHHDAVLIAFDEHFARIAKVSRLRTTILLRAS